MLKKASKSVAISIVTSFIVTGCSIKPEPMLNDDIKKQIENNLTVLNEVALPVTKPITIEEAIQRGLNHNLSKT